MKNITSSVLISNYNHSHFLARCLDSIVNQTHLPNEVIVIDDNSSDNSREILDSYAIRYKFVKVIYNDTNKGPVINANNLIELASSDYIIMTGADDFLREDYLERSLNLLKNNPGAGLCASLPGYIEEDNEEIKLNSKYYVPFQDNFGGYITSERLCKLLKNKNFNIQGNTCILKRSACIEFNKLNHNLN